MSKFNLNSELEDDLATGVPAASILFFDFEWVPNEPLLKEISGFYSKPRSEYSSLIAPDVALKLTIPEFKAYLEENRPDMQWLLSTEHLAKSASGKKTIGDLVAAELDALRDGDIPPEVMSMAETQQIVTMSWAIGYGPVEQIGFNEHSICTELAEILLQNLKPAGWAIRSSDIPMYLAACARNSVNPMRSFDLKYGSDMLDMYEIRFGRGNKGKLQDLAIATGFRCEETDPLKNGGEVAAAFKSGRLGDIMQHNKIDILKLQHVHKHYSGIYW